MNDAMIRYTVNLIIGAILAGVMSGHWRLEARGGSLRYWIIAARTLTATDLIFVLRAAYPDVVARMLPTLMVTALTTHRVNVTHGICEDCAAKYGAADTPPSDA